MMSEFDDVDMDNGHGIFGLGGITPDVVGKMNRVNSKLSPGGVDIEFHCPNCKKEMQLTYEYPELVAIGVGVAPQYVFNSGTQWNFDQKHNAFYPTANCGQCDAPLPVSVTMSEAAKYVNGALQNGFLNQQQYQQLAQNSQMVKQRMSGR